MNTLAVTTIFLILSVITLANATNTRQCPGFARKLTDDEVSVSNCKSGTCKLRRKTEAHIIMKFTPEKDVKRLITTVNANILDVPFPFIGVDGTSACTNIYFDDENLTKADCPLKAGQRYVYKNSFKILEIYPKINLVVHWALTSNTNEVISCFEVPARIV